MGAIERKNLAEPDLVRELDHASLTLTRVGAHSVGTGVLQPGWVWSAHMGPVMGTALCPVRHLQLIRSGRIAFRMEDGEEVELQPGDVADIPPGHEAWVVGDEPCVVLDIAGNIDIIGLPQDHERLVTTLLFSDIVDSTKTAERVGDQAWKQLLAEHDRIVRIQIDRYRGTEVNTTGDGFLAMFASAAGAMRCALAIRDNVRALGLEVRIGVHSGEVEPSGSSITGINIHAAARIMALAAASQIFVSSVARGLADGSGLSFEDAGRHEVKGLERPVEIAALLG
jgi:class 3 adenylate cyclase